MSWSPPIIKSRPHNFPVNCSLPNTQVASNSPWTYYPEDVEPKVHNRHQTGMVPFMAMETLCDGIKVKNRPRHNLKSLFYVFLWIFLNYRGPITQSEMTKNTKIYLFEVGQQWWHPQQDQQYKGQTHLEWSAFYQANTWSIPTLLWGPQGTDFSHFYPWLTRQQMWHYCHGHGSADISKPFNIVPSL